MFFYGLTSFIDALIAINTFVLKMVNDQCMSRFETFEKHSR